MARRFITQKELDYINRVTKELVQATVGQEVLYYQIALDENDAHRVYKEAVRKTWKPPVKCNALVQWTDNAAKSGLFNLDQDIQIEVYFHKDELDDRNLVPREGDFVEFGQVYFEIASVAQPQITFGQIQAKVMYKCVCVASREMQFQTGGSDDESVDHSTPIQNKPPRVP